MAREHPSGDFWPTPSQRRLLVAALADPDAAIEAWQLAQPDLDIEHLEPGSFELLPLVHRNLVSGGYDDPEMPRLRGIYRRAWVKNQLLVERLKETVGVLDAGKIRSLVIDGPTIAARYYGDVGLRPTSFFHLLVDRESEQRALARLPRARWALQPGGLDGGSRVLADGEGNGIVLRTTLAYDFVARPGPTHEPIWQAAEPQDVGGRAVLVECPTDALLTSCVVGARSTSVRSVQWIADGAMIVRTGQVDWDRLVELGTARGQILRLRAALGYVSALPGVDVPRDVLARLETFDTTRRERLAYACAGASSSRLGSLPEIVAEHLAATTGQSPLTTIGRLPNMLRARWGLEHARQLPLAAGRRAIGRLTPRRPV